MAEYVLSCESAIDLPEEIIREAGLQCMHYEYDLGNDHLTDDSFQSISDEDFYNRMAAGELTKTAAFNQICYEEFFEPFLKEGKDVLHITLSSGLTSTIQNAKLAQEELSERYPDRKILIVDGISACSGYGLLMLELSEKKKNGMTLEELKDAAEDLKMHVSHLFFSTDLTFYIRGGRISKAAGVFASALSICPFCDMDDMGFLIVREKVRTKKKVKLRMVERALELADNGSDYGGRMILTHSNCKEDAEDVLRLLEEKFPQEKGKISLYPIGPTIGAHTGPGTVALFFTGKAREESERSREAKNS